MWYDYKNKKEKKSVQTYQYSVEDSTPFKEYLIQISFIHVNLKEQQTNLYRNHKDKQKHS